MRFYRRWCRLGIARLFELGARGSVEGEHLRACAVAVRQVPNSVPIRRTHEWLPKPP